MPQITDEECRRLVNEFLEAHIENYTEREATYIRRNAVIINKKSINTYIGDVLRQIYDEVGIIPETSNMYSRFVNILEENFDIDRDIVEVAGGIIPTLAKKISLRQKNGTITVYDPRLIELKECPANLVIKRQMFSSHTQIPHAQMIIGFMPCDATIPIINSACLNNIDFAIALCEGGARQGYEWLETEEEWLGYVTHLARRGIERNNMGTLESASLEEYGNPYPIIYNKRRNK